MATARSRRISSLLFAALALSAVVGLLAMRASRTGAAQAPDGSMAWMRWGPDVVSRAQKEEKLILVDVYADWCGPCKMMDETTYKDPAVLKRLEGFVLVKIDSDAEPEAAARFFTGPLPTTAVLDASGEPLLTQEAYLSADRLLSMLDRAQKILVELTRLEQEAEANPEDPAKALILGNGYLALKRPASAIPWLERALAGKGVLERKARAAATYNLGVAHLQNGTFDKGIAQFEAFQITFGPGPQADKAAELVEIGRYLWAGARVKAGETAEAQALYERLVKESRNKGLVEDVRQRLFTLKAVGRAAPGLQVSDWIKGGPTTLQKLKGKVVLLDFFQIICPGCRRAHPHILEMQKKYGPQGLQVLGIAVAFEQQHVQTKRHIRDYVKETKFTFPVAIDKDFTATFSAYGARGTPYVAILDRRGRVRHLGFYNPIEVERLLRAVLAEEGSQPAPGGER